MKCRRSRETAKCSSLGEAAGSGYCAAHSCWYRGFRFHLRATSGGTPRALTLADLRRDEREVLACDKGHVGCEFADAAAELGVVVVRPARRDQLGSGLTSRIRQRIESIFWTCEDLLTLERYGAGTWPACVSASSGASSASRSASVFNHRLGGPSRALFDYCA